ncbi:hypothetical protein SPRG_15503 [Saprolegnia parasitica CBS 223.65]|uniref:AB hydrolase-1 domain-containing protein n=1 Tax=Saprolegnia parasitica (strain CBS 223.65) TaxID=695850 RepID=A0A067BLZ8_SAPPC|nr:hypothetical protein SPRG_15503 [Saprolegnia parasitica CBS 223.65]KDO17750.1 hypothetical protein SPRG_15503 [Saprolegnia parasitica CBS 223.65]|eukprot:XP_012211543.1 hypothetical protein SPRG_15503 [Saprolegnia parasitica CBS 223.65]
MVKAIVVSAVMALAAASADPFHWGPCAGNPDLRTQCGYLTVPLDHLNVTNKATIDIVVQRYRSTAAKPLGTILLNPGGPGGSGTALGSPVATFLTGGQYDVLGFDPRGVGQSRPIHCAKDGFAAWVGQYRLFTSSGVFYDPLSDDQIDRYGSVYDQAMARCRHYDGDYLPYLSTAFVARDMDLIRAALGQDHMHYFGFSYGTVLGATYANMFPHRVGRFVIDSVVDATKYSIASASFWATTIANIEDVLDGFAAECEVAGPLVCPLAGHGTPLAPRLRSFIQNFTPKVVRGGYDVAQFTSTDLYTLLLGPMYQPAMWPKLAIDLYQLMQGTYVAPPASDVCPSQLKARDLGLNRIPFMGNDIDSTTNTAQSWADGLRAAQKISPIFGGPWLGTLMMTKYWKTTSIERFAGPWNQTLANKILILNNVHDPVTPLVAAQHMHNVFGANNSVLVVRDGYGHIASTSQPSACVHDIVTAYFSHGVLPTTTFCKVDRGPFAAPSTHSAIALAAQELSTIVHKAHPGRKLMGL